MSGHGPYKYAFFFLWAGPPWRKLLAPPPLRHGPTCPCPLQASEMLSCETGAVARLTQEFFSSVKIAFPNTYYSYYTWLANQHFLFIFYIFFLLSFFHSTLVINFHFSVLYFSAMNHSILKKSHLGAIFLVSLFIDLCWCPFWQKGPITRRSPTIWKGWKKKS